MTIADTDSIVNDDDLRMMPADQRDRAWVLRYAAARGLAVPWARRAMTPFERAQADLRELAEAVARIEARPA